MKYTIEIPDQEADFVLEFLRRVTSVKLTPVQSKAVKRNTTDYLLNPPDNARELKESTAQPGKVAVPSDAVLSDEEREHRFLALFGAWQSDETGDELNQMLRESRRFNRPDVEL